MLRLRRKKKKRKKKNWIPDVSYSGGRGEGKQLSGPWTEKKKKEAAIHASPFRGEKERENKRRKKKVIAVNIRGKEDMRS